MKELNNYNKLSEKDSIESIQEKKQQQEYRLIGDLRPKKGHTVWEIDVETLNVEKAEFIKEINETITWEEACNIFKNGDSKKGGILIKQNKVYISSLSPTTALERYLSGKGSSKMNERKNISLF